jgi:hypothetical protein
MGPYVALLIAGFAVGIAGHVFRVRWMIALGIALIFIATLVLPVLVNLIGDEPAPPGPNVPTPY